MSTWVEGYPPRPPEMPDPVPLIELFEELLAYFDVEERQKTLRRMPYADYLETEHWKMTRRYIVEQRGGHCQRCGDFRDLNVHHLTYKNLGAENDEDLELLCRSCHENEHGIEKAS